MTDDAMLIEMSDVSIERGNTRILDRVSLRIPQGQHVAIVGPNGSGKSTLLKLLMKFFYPSVIDGASGTIRILGQEEWNVWELRSRLGFVSSEIDQHFTMGRSARLNALQSVITGFFSGELEPDSNLVNDEMRCEAIRQLNQFQVDNHSAKYIGHMSTGERRRVLLARSLVMRPQAVILDEPTAGLDILARANFLGELNSLANTGVQIILVTHHLEEILPCIDRTILLKAGKVFSDSPTNIAICEEAISSLFDTRILVDRNAAGFYHSRLACPPLIPSLH